MVSTAATGTVWFVTIQFATTGPVTPSVKQAKYEEVTVTFIGSDRLNCTLESAKRAVNMIFGDATI